MQEKKIRILDTMGLEVLFEYEYVRYFYTKYRDTLIDVNDVKVKGRGE